MANSRHFPRPTGANLAVDRWSINGPLDPVVHWTSALTLSCVLVRIVVALTLAKYLV